jgi:Arc/MetJ-type ribon-helix-helix transcriptional regulator
MEANIVRVSLNLPVRIVRILDELVQMGVLIDWTEVIRHILREYCLKPNASIATAEPKGRSWRKRSVDDMMVQVSFALPKLIAAQLEKWARAGIYRSRYAVTQAILIHYAPRALEQYRGMANGVGQEGGGP